MVQPVDYSGAFAPQQNPLKSFADSFGVFAGIREQQQQQALREQQIARQQTLQTDLAALSANPTPEAIARLSVKYPELSEQFKRSYDMLTPGQQQARVEAMLPIYAALQNKRPEVAVDLLRKQATALENGGKAQEAAQVRSHADMIEQSPQTGYLQGGLLLASAMGPEKFAETLSKLGGEARANEVQPLDVRKKAADATTAEATAAVAPEKATAEARKATFDAAVAQVTAQTAPEKARLELAKTGADIGLTKAQTTQAIASARKLTVDAQVAAVQAAGAAAGLLPPKDKFEAEQKLRKEHSDQTKVFQDVNEAYKRITSTENTGAGDIALVYGYMKMLDPGSVVREGEFATAQNSGGIPDAVRNAYNRALNGQRLTPEQRRSFKSQAGKLYEKAKERDTEVRASLTKVAEAYKLDTKQIFYTPEPPAAAAQPANPQAASGTVTQAPKVGTVEDGYRFKGGNPADPKAWERVK